MDSIFIKRLWRSLKNEAVYLQDIDEGFAAQRVIDEWMNFDNSQRQHSAFGTPPPDEAYAEERFLIKSPSLS
ncbi:integrase core domain-containing protein [Hyphomonas oceanitis]|uniref:integrase core domain-containing protein n=1 Tax=Hyphomonas oceanitis TaxID=81033 RepID=UPI0005509F7E